jgi:hypothetical protein
MVLETTAFREYGTENAAQAGGVERSGVALDNRIEDGSLACFVGDGKAVFALEAGDFSDRLGAPVDEVEKFEIEFVDGAALLVKGRGHGSSLLLKTVQKHKGRDL